MLQETQLDFQIGRRLLALGFSQVRPLTPEDAERYYNGQPVAVAPLNAWQLRHWCR